MLGSVIRSLLVATLIIIIGMLFGAVSLINPVGFFLYIFGVSAIFSLLGMLVGLWAQGFEQLSVLNTFVITPLTYLGGIFYSINMLPETVRLITLFNPFFYFVDGIRSTMIGVNEASTITGILVIGGLLIGLSALIFTLFQRGWRVRS